MSTNLALLHTTQEEENQQVVEKDDNENKTMKVSLESFRQLASPGELPALLGVDERAIAYIQIAKPQRGCSTGRTCVMPAAASNNGKCILCSQGWFPASKQLENGQQAKDRGHELYDPAFARTSSQGVRRMACCCDNELCFGIGYTDVNFPMPRDRNIRRQWYLAMGTNLSRETKIKIDENPAAHRIAYWHFSPDHFEKRLGRGAGRPMFQRSEVYVDNDGKRWTKCPNYPPPNNSLEDFVKDLQATRTAALQWLQGSATPPQWWAVMQARAASAARNPTPMPRRLTTPLQQTNRPPVVARNATIAGMSPPSKSFDKKHRRTSMTETTGATTTPGDSTLHKDQGVTRDNFTSLSRRALAAQARASRLEKELAEALQKVALGDKEVNELASRVNNTDKTKKDLMAQIAQRDREIKRLHEKLEAMSKRLQGRLDSVRQGRNSNSPPSQRASMSASSSSSADKTSPTSSPTTRRHTTALGLAPTPEEEEQTNAKDEQVEAAAAPKPQEEDDDQEDEAVPDLKSVAKQLDPILVSGDRVSPVPLAQEEAPASPIVRETKRFAQVGSPVASPKKEEDDDDVIAASPVEEEQEVAAEVPVEQTTPAEEEEETKPLDSVASTTAAAAEEETSAVVENETTTPVAEEETAPVAQEATAPVAEEEETTLIEEEETKALAPVETTTPLAAAEEETAPVEEEETKTLDPVAAIPIPPSDTEEAAKQSPERTPAPQQEQAAGSSDNKHPAGIVYLYFASESGTAASFGRQLQRESANHGFLCKLIDFETVDTVESLQSPCAILSATTGEGEAPENAAEFAELLQKAAGMPILFEEADEDDISEPQLILTHVDYCVFGLGDRQYDHFNAMGKFFDEALFRCGGKRLLPVCLGDDDEDLEEDFESWKDEQFWPKMKELYQPSSSDDVAAAAAAATTTPEADGPKEAESSVEEQALVEASKDTTVVADVPETHATQEEDEDSPAQEETVADPSDAPAQDADMPTQEEEQTVADPSYHIVMGGAEELPRPEEEDDVETSPQEADTPSQDVLDSTDIVAAATVATVEDEAPDATETSCEESHSEDEQHVEDVTFLGNSSKEVETDVNKEEESLLFTASPAETEQEPQETSREDVFRAAAVEEPLHKEETRLETAATIDDEASETSSEPADEPETEESLVREQSSLIAAKSEPSEDVEAAEATEVDEAVEAAPASLASSPSPVKEQVLADRFKYPGGAFHLYFASQTGTAESFCRQLRRESADNGFLCHLVDMEDVTEVEALQSPCVIVSATTGDGEATDNAVKFAELLEKAARMPISFETDKEPQDDETTTEQPPSILKHVEYCVFGLGDRQYDNFNAMGKFFNEALFRCGAKRILPVCLGDDDEDLDEDFEAWKDEQFWPKMKELYHTKGVNVASAASEELFTPEEASASATKVEEMKKDEALLEDSPVKKQENPQEEDVPQDDVKVVVAPSVPDIGAASARVDDSPVKEAALVDPSKFPGGNMHIYFATEMGTAESFGRQLERDGPKHGFLCHLVDLEKVKTIESLQSPCVVVSATTGEGEPTGNAVAFAELLQKAACMPILFESDDSGQTGQPQRILEHVQYCVFGLGDSQYEHFNAMSKFFNEALSRCGGRQMLPLCLGDDDKDLDEDFETWKDEKFWPKMKELFHPRQEEAPAVDEEGVSEAFPACPFVVDFLDMTVGAETDWKLPLGQVHGASRHYFDAVELTVKAMRELRSPNDSGSTVHLELSGKEDGTATLLNYQTADNLGVLPVNDVQHVESVANSLGYDLNAIFSVRAAPDAEWHGAPFPMPLSIRTLLTHYCDLTSAPRRSELNLLSKFANDKGDQQLLQHLSSRTSHDEYRTEIVDNYLGLVHILLKCPSIRIPLEHFLDICPQLQPRFFTISSSSSAHPQSIHVTVSVTEATRPSDQTTFHGVCSTYLAHRKTDSNDPNHAFVRAFVRPSSFRLPEDVTKPILMVGPGTGVAPMRGFLQERQHQKQASESDVGKNILYFGCKKEELDYLYQDELEAWVQDGTLYALRAAFSREQEEKVYVQDLLLQNSEETFNLINKEGAFVYVCGGVKMGHDVQEALKSILRQGLSVEGKEEVSGDDAKKYLDRLAREGRYVQELW